MVVGAGPAGMAAALEAANAGLSVSLVDEDRRLGGQYYRGSDAVAGSGAPTWFAAGPRLRVRLETAVVDAQSPTQLTTWSPEQGVGDLRCDGLVLATGAIDRPCPLPGWTTPGVLTAGGALTLAKSHFVPPGRRVVLSGSGPFLLPVAAAMLAAGASVTVLEATPLLASVRGLPALLRDRSTLRQAAGYFLALGRDGCRIEYARGVTAIGGESRVKWAEISSLDGDWRPISGTSRRVEADAVVLGYGFVPRVDLASLVGCRLATDASSMTQHVAVDGHGRSSLQGVYAAGEAVGVAGSRIAQLEGRIAGLTAALDLGVLSPSSHARRVAQIRHRFVAPARSARWISDAFHPRAGLFERASMDTVICRCEEVTRADVERLATAATAGAPTARGIKLLTRAGMGLCQGRMCAPTLLAWASRSQRGLDRVQRDGAPAWTPRPPIRPVPFTGLGALPESESRGRP